MLNIHIFSTGTEITSGKSVDSNSTWIANELTGLGFTVSRFVVLPDKPLLIEREIRSVMAQPGPSLIVMTGGLGATEDDYTLQVLLQITGGDTVTHAPALEKLVRVAELRGKVFQDLLPVSKRQTLIPANARALENTVGIAPGFYLNLSPTTRFAAMPGVPKEMKTMFTQELLPLVQADYANEGALGGARCIWAMSESVFQEQFIRAHPELLGTEVEWGVTAKPGYIKVTFKSADQSRIDRILEKIDAQYAGQIANDVLGEVHRILTESHQTVATAESCTGGLIGKVLTDVPGASAYYLGSVVAYQNEIKSKLLGVQHSTLKQFGAVSEEVAAEMASGVQTLLGCDYAVSVTGIAGPDGGSKEKKVGLAYIGIKAGPHKPVVYRYHLTLGREVFRDHIANLALFHLYKALKVSSTPG